MLRSTQGTSSSDSVAAAQEEDRLAPPVGFEGQKPTPRFCVYCGNVILKVYSLTAGNAVEVKCRSCKKRQNIID